MKDDALLIVLTTVPNREVAEALANLLVERRHVACVNVLPGVMSYYRWEGKTESSEELLLIMKCPSGSYEELQQTITENHPYQVPEIVALDACRVSESYLRWALQVTAISNPSP